MALWLIRGGSHGEFEEKFFEEKKIYLTWDDLKDRDFRGAKDYNAIKEIVRGLLPDGPERRIGNFSGQAWAFVLSMKAGDLVVTPRKRKSVVAVGAITSSYKYDADAPHPFNQRMLGRNFSKDSVTGEWTTLRPNSPRRTGLCSNFEL